MLGGLIQELLEDLLELALEYLVHPKHHLRLLLLLHIHMELLLLILCHKLLLILWVSKTLIKTTSILIVVNLSKLRLMLIVIHRDQGDLLLLSDLHLTEHLLLPLDHYLLLFYHILLPPSLLLELGHCQVLLLGLVGLLITLGGHVLI